MTRQDLTHVDETGAARMVDVTEKAVTRREAQAAGRVLMAPETLDLIRRNALAKGDVLAVARLAGIMAAKRTDELIPLCHGLALTGVDVEFDLEAAPGCIDIVATARVEGKTGVEMEAMTAVSVAALTIYDMCKAVDRSMVLSDIRLVAKSGGRSGEYRRS
ncbi:MAG TPA: cyclic pyranopterin monophosphate synthase MoaC [Chloroflexota bacterium]|nr:cyclic pyranopterin monophosphate synthase MoaC [Chloroflexota bacterium]